MGVVGQSKAHHDDRDEGGQDLLDRLGGVADESVPDVDGGGADDTGHVGAAEEQQRQHVVAALLAEGVDKRLGHLAQQRQLDGVVGGGVGTTVASTVGGVLAGNAGNLEQQVPGEFHQRETNAVVVVAQTTFQFR